VIAEGTKTYHAVEETCARGWLKRVVADYRETQAHLRAARERAIAMTAPFEERALAARKNLNEAIEAVVAIGELPPAEGAALELDDKGDWTGRIYWDEEK